MRLQWHLIIQYLPEATSEVNKPPGIKMEEERYPRHIAEDCDDDAKVPLLDAAGSINKKSYTEELPSVLPRNLQRMSESSVVKNLFVMCVCLMVLCTGLQGLSNLQSTMNGEHGLGVDSQAVIYAFSMLSSILLPTLMVTRLGCKTTIVFMMITTIPYIIANFYPTWRTLMPTAILSGLSAGPLCTAIAIYTNELAYSYRIYVTDSIESVVSRFYGVYSFFTENTQIWGNLLSYLILMPTMERIQVHSNSTQKCGVWFVNYDKFTNASNPNLEPPKDKDRFTLVWVYTGCALLATFMLFLFLDSLDSDRERSGGNEDSPRETCCSSLLAAVKHLSKPNQILLLPLTVYCGLENAFYTADFTKAYIACSWGIHHVGFVTICFGVTGALMAVLVGELVKHLTQTFVFIAAGCISMATYVCLYLWDPNPSNPVIFFIVAGVWGLTDAVWWSQIPALYGMVFNDSKEGAFSNFYFWSYLGFFVNYSYANCFSVSVKINILMCFLLIGMIGYLTVQLKTKISARRQYILIADN